ncbi:bifunctional coenzyme a synthase [Nannochloropsis oceanica]
MGRSECNHYIGLGTQGAGVAAFVTTVLGYTLVHKMLCAPWCRPSSSSAPRGLRGMNTSPPPTLAAKQSSNSNVHPTALPYQVGLLDLTVPSKHTGGGGSSQGYTNLLLANDICIEKAVQSVSDTLYIYLREDPTAVSASASASYLPPSESAPLSPTTPELRVYLSELYGQLWDVCYLHKNLPLDVRILYNTTEQASLSSSSTPLPSAASTSAASNSLSPAAAPAAVSGKKSKKEKGSKEKDAAELSATSSLLSKSSPRQKNIPTSWEEALLKPELQVVFIQHKNANSEQLSNARREALGLPPVQIEWLDDSVHTALSTSFYYLEDEDSHIPHFPRVAVGGTFDRLHNGHKKLLTLAACVCQTELTIGITSTEMLANKKNAAQIEPLADRIEAVRAFLHSVFPNLPLDIVVLKDPFGPPVHNEKFDAIVVSSETIAGAAKINELRVEKGFKPLVVVVTRRTVSSLLSSTFIRNNLPPRRKQGK